MEVRYTAKAIEHLDALEEKTSQRIVKKIGWFAVQGDPLVFAKRLTGEWGHLYRFRVGEYRAVFSKEKDGTVSILMILAVKHRKEIYG